MSCFGIFCPFTIFVHSWGTYVWSCIAVLVFVDYVPSLLWDKGNNYVVISQKPKTGKITVLSNLPQFPPKISFIWKIISCLMVTSCWKVIYKKSNTTDPFFLVLLKLKIFAASTFGHVTVLFLKFLKNFLHYFKEWDIMKKEWKFRLIWSLISEVIKV